MTVPVSILGYAVTNFFITADLSSTWLIWLLMGTAVGLADHLDDDSASLVESPSKEAFADLT